MHVDRAEQELGVEQRRVFRDEMREARGRVLADAEAYASPLHVLERLGRYFNPGATSLWHIRDHLCSLAADSPLSELVPDVWHAFHRPFPSLLDTIRRSRNDVMHIGAKARHLTNHLIEACLILEDALAKGLTTIAHFMVSDPVTVADWQPVSLVRLRMLSHSFTFIPVRPADESSEWVLVADHHLARFLGAGGQSQRAKRLAMSIRDALASGLGSTVAEFIDPHTLIEVAIEQLQARPILVGTQEQVVGIVTAFDLI